MRLIAHRGFASTAPENTISAVQNAASYADAVEFDVRRCGSGELVVIHDDTVDRVTDGTGAVANLSLEELQTLSVLGTGERIPTLEAMLDALPPTVEANLEMKEPDIAPDVVELTESISNRIVLTSFHESALASVRDIDTDRPTGLLVNREIDSPVSRAIELECDVIGANYWRCLFTRLVPRAKAVGLEVHAWSIERRVLATLLGLRGVDCISADRPIDLSGGLLS